MDHQAIRELHRPLPLLPRLIRLELTMQLLMERYCWSKELALETSLEPEDECKDISLALEEVEKKGSIAHRLTMLEKRLFQMSLELEQEGKNSKSMPFVGLEAERKENLQSKSDPFEKDQVREEEIRQDGGRKRNAKRRWFICS